MHRSLASRTISSTLWQSVANILSIGILFLRSILLARWIPVEIFGIYGYAGAIIGLTAILSDFGIGAAFLHRAEETQDEQEAAANTFTLKVVLTLIWAGLMGPVAFTVIGPQYRAAALWLMLIRVGVNMTATPRLILQRRVVHRRLSLLSTLDDVISTAAALTLARLGHPLAALLVTNLVTLLVGAIGLYIWRPVWRPRWRWSPPVMRYLLGYGARNVLAGLLARAIDQVDDVWTGYRLGSTAVGFYSKAYAFATYPRRIVAAPLIHVATGSYAALKGRRKRLSQAFFRVNAALIRSSFLFGGALTLVAPEFIRILLGERWMPMLDAYRLMLIFTLLDPIKATLANLFIAVGKPEQVTMTRLAQLITLLLGLVTLGPALGIAGVAIAVDLMLLVGIAILLWRARDYVDFTPRRLFAVPTLALIVGMGIARATLLIPGVLGSDWRTAGTKLTAFTLCYGGILLSLERRETQRMLTWAVSALYSKVR